MVLTPTRSPGEKMHVFRLKPDVKSLPAALGSKRYTPACTFWE